jgi:hypothetical protein
VSHPDSSPAETYALREALSKARAMSEKELEGQIREQDACRASFNRAMERVAQAGTPSEDTAVRGRGVIPSISGCHAHGTPSEDT